MEEMGGDTKRKRYNGRSILLAIALFINGLINQKHNTGKMSKKQWLKCMDLQETHFLNLSIIDSVLFSNDLKKIKFYNSDLKTNQVA